jgi:hypothetical protein
MLTGIAHFDPSFFDLSLREQLVTWFHELYHRTGYRDPDSGPSVAEQQGQIMADILLMYADRERDQLQREHSAYTKWWEDFFFELECAGGF